MPVKKDKITIGSHKIEPKFENIHQLIERYKVAGDTVNLRRWQAILERLKSDLKKAS